jgi:hypothetical protein
MENPMTNQNNESVADEIIGVTMDTELSLPQMTKRIVGILEQQLTAANQQIKALRESIESMHKAAERYQSERDQLKAELEAMRSAFCQECAKALVTGGRYAVGTCLHCTGVKREAELEAARAVIPADVRLFIRRVTLELQHHRSRSREQMDAMFQEAYRFYAKYKADEQFDALLADATKGKEQA